MSEKQLMCHHTLFFLTSIGITSTSTCFPPALRFLIFKLRREGLS